MNGKRLPVRKESKPSKTHKTSNIVLIILGVFLLVFEVCMVVLFCLYQSVPDTLIQYTLGAGGVEALVLAGIKISKVVTGQKAGESEETYE